MKQILLKAPNSKQRDRSKKTIYTELGLKQINRPVLKWVYSNRTLNQKGERLKKQINELLLKMT